MPANVNGNPQDPTVAQNRAVGALNERNIDYSVLVATTLRQKHRSRSGSKVPGQASPSGPPTEEVIGNLNEASNKRISCHQTGLRGDKAFRNFVWNSGMRVSWRAFDKAITAGRKREIYLIQNRQAGKGCGARF